MQAILAVTVPFFALVLLGWLAARAGPLPESAIPGLNAYVLFFALPCMLFRLGSSLPLARLIDPALIAIYLLCAVLVVALTVAITWRRVRAGGVDLRDAAFGALVAAFPNAGFMGVPLLVALFGDAAAGPVIGAILVDLIVTSTLCLALAQAASHRATRDAGAEHHALHAALLSLRGALANPLPWAIVLGATFALGGLALPGPLAQIVRMLGHAGGAVHDRRGPVSRRATCAHANADRPLPAGGARQARRPSGAGVRCLPGDARPRRVGLAVRPDGAHVDRGTAEREQRCHPRRTLRRRQRAHRSNHHGLDRPRLRHLLGHRLGLRTRPQRLTGASRSAYSGRPRVVFHPASKGVPE